MFARKYCFHYIEPLAFWKPLTTEKPFASGGCKNISRNASRWHTDAIVQVVAAAAGAAENSSYVHNLSAATTSGSLSLAHDFPCLNCNSLLVRVAHVIWKTHILYMHEMKKLTNRISSLVTSLFLVLWQNPPGIALHSKIRLGLKPSRSSTTSMLQTLAVCTKVNARAH